jgi:multiple sugar transport system substrate-binding protein
MERSWLDRWSSRRVCVFGALLFLVGCASGQSGTRSPSSAFNWRQAQGTTLRVLLTESHWALVIRPHLPEFEELTGIRLATELHSQNELWEALETGLKQPGRVDVFMTVPGLDGLRYLRAGGIQPVNDFLGDPTLTAPDYAWVDFLPRTRAAMEIEGAILGPPVMAEHLALFYRKDLFKQYGATVPRTLDELEATARFLHKKSMGPAGAPGVGLVSRGRGAAATPLYGAILHALGGTWLDGDRHPTINGPQGLAALERLGRLLGSYAPPNVSDFGWQEASDLFVDGGAAMYIEGSSVYPLVEESAKSRVIGKVGYAIFPAGPGGPGTTIAVRGLAIAKQSAHPQAAWLFLQWASSRKMVERALIKGVLVARESTWKDRSLYDGEIPVDLAQSLQEAGRIGTPHWAPPMVAVAAGREAIGPAIQAAIRGEDYRAAANTAAQRLTEILQTTEGREGRPAAPRTGRPGSS